MAKPMTMPIRLLITESWLAVPIETLNVVAMSTRRVPVKKGIEVARKVHRSRMGTRRVLQKLLAASGTISLNTYPDFTANIRGIYEL